MKYSYAYILSIQFLGFRFSGWQKQPGVKTLHDRVDKTLSFVLPKETYKTIGTGRTDAKVSANTYLLQLFVSVEIKNTDYFLNVLNANFSSDIRAIDMFSVPRTFNIINAPKIKEYHYYFAFGAKSHPFCAPLLHTELDNLDILQMQKAAHLFKGTHYFNKYCTKPSKNTQLKRVIVDSEILENTILTASFFPKKSYVLKVSGKGFLRYQIRLIMATLIEVGKGNLSLEYIKLSLKEDNDKQYMRHIAPGSGLQLFAVKLEV